MQDNPRAYSHTKHIGKRNRRITIERITESRSDTGAEVQTWSPLMTVWAHKREPSQKGDTKTQEMEHLMQVSAMQEPVWEIRYRRDIDVTEKYRLRYEGRYFDILGIEEYGFKELWIIKSRIVQPNKPTP